MCVTSSEIYALCGEHGVEFVKLLPGTDVLAPEAFCGCSSLTSVTFPEGLQQVGWGAFSGCSSLTPATTLALVYLLLLCYTVPDLWSKMALLGSSIQLTT